ncbi:MAG: hypothetical protein ACOYIF_07970 [Acetivibrionales bacterium]
MLTALGIVLLIGLRDDAMETVGDMENQVDLPVLGTILWHIP